MLGPAGGSTEVLLTPFIGVRNLFSVGYCGWPVEALSERISDQGPRCGMVPTDPTMDISQQLLPLFDGDAVLQDPGVALLVKLPLIGATRQELLNEGAVFI